MERAFSPVALGGGVLSAAALWGVAWGAAALLEERLVVPRAEVVTSQRLRSDNPTALAGVDGVVVWESNRGGRWRLWQRALAGGEVEPVLPAEGDVRQCCPQLSPDGRHLAFLELPAGPDRYPEIETGRLLLLERSTGAVRELADVARTYGENRAVVWRDATHLVWLDRQGRTVETDLATGTQAVVLAAGHATLGYLPSPDLRFATTGYPTFSPIEDGRVIERHLLGGCQPIFSPDGRYGLWASGAGGPIDRIDLASRAIETVLEKNDPALPLGRGYVYFPSLSADGRLLAVAASPDEHNHFTADYDVMVMELDADLRPLGPAAVIGADPAVDRFPTVWAAPLALGRFEGEVPFLVAPQLPAGEWQVELVSAAGSRSELEAGSASIEEPGRFRLVATGPSGRLEGLVVAHEASPPRLERVVWRGEGLDLWFDEALAAVPTVRGSALEVTLAERRVRLQGALEPGQRIELDGVVDRAEPPNRTTVAIEVPRREWPADPEGVVVAWGGGSNPAGAAAAELPLAPSGLARFDRHFALESHGDGGWWAPPAVVSELIDRIKGVNRLRVEVAIDPAEGTADGPIVALSGGRGRGQRLFVLEQRGDRLWLVLTTAGEGPVTSELELGALPSGSSWWSIAWQPGLIRAWRDGQPLVTADHVQGDLFHWKTRPLAVGAEPPDRGWRGRVEALAFGTGAVDDTLAAEAFARWRERRETRPAVAPSVVRGRIVGLAPVPRLDDISPYRDALRVVRIEVEGGAAGAGRLVHVAERVLLDGRTLPAADRTIGARVELEVEPFGAQPQLEATYLAEGDLGPPEWFVVR